MRTMNEWQQLSCEQANQILQPLDAIERLKELTTAPDGTPYDEWKRKSKAELMQWYMNAYITCKCAAGHNKAHMNEVKQDSYFDAMQQYNVPIPSHEIICVLGKFNGEGSY